MKTLNFKVTQLLLLLCLASMTAMAQNIAVWPGDADNNGMVNNIDLLYLGKALGAQGPARNGASIIWGNQTALVWNTSFPDSAQTNYGYADCDGDGVVNEDDTLAIAANYGLLQGIPIDSPKYSKDSIGAPPLYFAAEDDTFGPSERIDLYVNLGDPSIPVDSFFAIAFSVKYDAALVKAASINAYLNTRWVGGQNQVLFIQHNNIDSSLLDVAVSIKALSGGVPGVISKGYGNIVQMSMVIEDNVFGVTPKLIIKPTKVRLIDKNFKIYPVNYVSDTINLRAGTTGIAQPGKAKDIAIYPNPTTGQINIDLGNNIAHQIMVFDILGNSIYTDVQTHTGNAHINLASVANGIYLVKIVTDNGAITKKINKIDGF